MHSIATLYVTLSHALKRYELFDSLQLIWGFSRNLIFDLPIPEDIELSPSFSYEADKQNRRFSTLPEFEMEFLVKEIIINCSTAKQPVTLKTHNNIQSIIRYVRYLDDEIVRQFATDNILLEFNRMVHRQFIWQYEYHTSIVMRYYKLYTHKDVIGTFESSIGLTPHQATIIGLAFFQSLGKHFAMPHYKHSNVPGITIEMFNKFLSLFSSPIDDLRNELISNQKLDQNLFYTYNPLLAKPIIAYKEFLLCPIPSLIFWKMTGGFYYSLVGKNNFEAFGKAFEDYVGEVIQAANTKNIITALPEQTYGKQEKKSADWVIYDSDAVLFVECKVKRMTLNSKTSLQIDSESGMLDDLTSLASAVVQLYKTFIDYQNGKYSLLTYDNTKKFYPVVVTLEEWFLPINPLLMQTLHEKVEEKLSASNLDVNLTKLHPFHISSVDHFENHIQIIQEKGITHFFDLLNSNNLSQRDYKHLFAGQFEELILKPVKLT
jgi:hypothetical protein